MGKINWEEWGFSFPQSNEERYKVINGKSDYSGNLNKNPYTYFSKPIKGILEGRKSYKTYLYMCRMCFSPTISEDRRMVMCKEWLDYCAFEEWWNNNYCEVEGEQMVLAPTIFDKNNKLYSPNTCCLVPRGIYECFKEKAKDNKDLPCGVNIREGYDVYFIGMSIENKRINVGVADTLEEALLVRNIFQTQKIHYLALKYKKNLSQKVYDFMKNLEVGYWN